MLFRSWEKIKPIWDFIVEGIKIYISIIGKVLGFVWDIIKTGLEVVWAAVKIIWDAIVAGVKIYISIIGKVIGVVWDVLSTALEFVWKLIKPIWDAIINGIKAYISTIGKVIGFVWDVLKTGLDFVWNGVKGIWNSIVGFVTGIVDKVKGVLSGIWNGLKDGLSGAWQAAKDWWNRNIAGKGFTIGGFKVGPIEIPKVDIRIPQLAEGGIVMPSRGGTVAQIAEAGRPERIEPLDPDGLSRRDKAMIQFLTGGRAGLGGSTFNIYPSQGMNESELAAMIDRTLAFRLRRGGA